LLDEIYESATRPEFVYRHHWQVGDALLWDNGFTMHRREPFDPSARRLMKRTTMFLSRDRHINPPERFSRENRQRENLKVLKYRLKRSPISPFFDERGRGV
jgi:hypothetical protein